jgi:hypothetical protein
MNINGDCYIGNKNNTYMFVDTHNNFLGINTLTTQSNYANTYNTTTNNTFSDNNVVISNNSYPNLLVERIAENDISNNPYDSSTPENPLNYFRFKNFTSLSSRRTSNLYNFQDMATNSKKFNTLIPDDLADSVGNLGTTLNAYGTKKKHLSLWLRFYL